VAVVSISRIQIRRGQKNSGTGLPQLASGELGWAIDTRELFIGNGAVSEGAPQVGNTKLLTEHDNLFQFADTYSYDLDSEIVQTGTSPTAPIQRTLQNRLDDRVSVRAFGCNGDGTVCTTELQRAIDQLYINTATKGNPSSRVVLHLEAGEYVIDDTIYLPPYASLVGAGKDKTIIKQTVAVPVFKTVNETSTPGNPADDSVSTFINQAQNIEIDGLTIDVTEAQGNYPVINLQSCRDSVFKNIKILGSYSLSEPTIDNFTIGIQLNALSTAVTSSGNFFENITVQDIGYAIDSKYDIKDNQFVSCVFDTVGFGIVFGNNISLGLPGQITGPSFNKIDSCVFRSVSRHAIWINAGQYNHSTNNKYFNVGNEDGTSANATHSVIYFNDEYNHSSDDYFQRANDLSVDQSFTSTAFVPLIEGKTFFAYDFNLKTTVTELPTPVTLFRLPGLETGSYDIDYWYNSNQYNALRSGTISIVFDLGTGNVSLSDDYDFVGALGLGNGLKFNAFLSDEDSDSGIDTLVITAENSASSDSAELYFKITSKS